MPNLLGQGAIPEEMKYGFWNPITEIARRITSNMSSSPLNIYKQSTLDQKPQENFKLGRNRKGLIPIPSIIRVLMKSTNLGIGRFHRKKAPEEEPSEINLSSESFKVIKI